MKKHSGVHIVFICIVLIVSIFNVQCAKRVASIGTSHADLVENRLQLFENLHRTVLRISCSAQYLHEYYSKPSNIHSSTDSSILLDSRLLTKSVAGTGTIIYNSGNKMLLLTCYHIFDFQDTIKTYHVDEENNLTDWLDVLSIKKTQSIFIKRANGTWDSGSLLAFDKKNDLALVLVDNRDNHMYEQVFEGLRKDVYNTKLGEQVSMLGFPNGIFMINNGLVSFDSNENRLIISAIFHNGASGGVVVSLDEVRKKYHFVGIAVAMPYEGKMLLAPGDNGFYTYNNMAAPYNGDVYVENVKFVKYGITYVIKNSVVIDFLKEKEDLLATHRIYLSGIFR